MSLVTEERVALMVLMTSLSKDACVPLALVWNMSSRIAALLFALLCIPHVWFCVACLVL